MECTLNFVKLEHQNKPSTDERERSELHDGDSRIVPSKVFLLKSMNLCTISAHEISESKLIATLYPDDILIIDNWTIAR